jgi:hypothetical protein
MTTETHRRDDDEGEKIEGEEGAEESVGTEDPPKRIYGLNDSALDDQRFMVADQEIRETFGTPTFEAIQRGRSRWAVRISGDGFDGASADPFKTAALLRRIPMTARWLANGLFSGFRGVPGFVQAASAHSIVLEFSLARDEKPVRILTDEINEQTETAERQIVFPSVEGGRYMGVLLGTAGDPDKLIQRFGAVGKQGVASYQGALREFVKYDAEVDLLVPNEVGRGEVDLRRISTSVEQSKAELKVLNRKPKSDSKTFEVEGLLYDANALKAEFGIQKDNEHHVTGEYELDVIDKLGPAWNKRVWARIREDGPREPWMPRAGRTRRVLVDVVVLKKGESRLTGKSNP